MAGVEEAGYPRAPRQAWPLWQEGLTDIAVAAAVGTLEPMEPQEQVTTRRMVLASNPLQASCYIHVISFEPPSEDGAEGLLQVRFGSELYYYNAMRFLDHERGSALSATDGSGQWFVHRIDDNVDMARPFPQHVTFRLEWRFR